VSKKKLSHEDVESRLSGSGLYWVGRYEGANKKVMVGCKACGHEWEVMPAFAFRGGRCRVCMLLGKGYRTGNDVLVDNGEWFEIDVTTGSRGFAVMKIDRIDYEYLRMNGTRRIFVNAKGYAVCRFRREQRLLHRVLMPDAIEVDHKNRDKLDNRRNNLRACESWQNQSNRGKRAHNACGHIGVDFNGGMWRAQMMVRGKVVLRKKFKNKEDAIAAYKEADLLHRGEFASCS
jgi:hypothetical protein